MDGKVHRQTINDKRWNLGGQEGLFRGCANLLERRGGLQEKRIDVNRGKRLEMGETSLA